MMQGVIQRGTATVIRELGRQYLAGKTGTTNDSKDVWFVGFSANLAVGVYLGFDKPKSLGDSATAGRYAAPVFRDFMRMALKDQPDTPFRIPAGMTLIRVGSGGLREGAGGGMVEAFKPGSAPPDSYSFPSAASGGGGGRSVGTGTGGLY